MHCAFLACKLIFYKVFIPDFLLCYAKIISERSKDNIELGKDLEMATARYSEHLMNI